MWFEIPIPADYETQKVIIRQLRTWIQDLESQRLIEGFAFNHYFGGGSQDTLRVRFDCTKENLRQVKKELSSKLEELNISCSLNENPWESPEHILKAYEFGSRCAFLLFELIESGRFSEDYVSDFLPPTPRSELPLSFQFHFNHGVMNSLGVPKRPNELIIHHFALGESIGQLFGLNLASAFRG